LGIWTDIAQWRGPTANCGDGDGISNEPGDRIVDHMYVVLHIAQGGYEGTIAWQRNPDANVASHFVVAKDGRIAQLVDTNIRAWTQALGNPYSISIENEGFVPTALTAQQHESCAKILAKAHVLHGIPLQVTGRVGTRGLGHHSMGFESGVNWGHSECPGINIKNQKSSIVQRAIQIVDGAGDMTPEETQMLRNLHDWMFDYVRGLVAADTGTPHITTYVPNEILTALRDRPPVQFTPEQLAALAAAIGSQLTGDLRAEVVAALNSTEGRQAIVAAVNEAEDS
jgi:hypothetical protein